MPFLLIRVGETQMGNPKCLACQKKRLHNETEWKLHHPLSRHGFTKEQGYSHPDVKKVMEEESKLKGKFVKKENGDVFLNFDPKKPKATKSIP